MWLCNYSIYYDIVWPKKQKEEEKMGESFHTSNLPPKTAGYERKQRVGGNGGGQSHGV